MASVVVFSEVVFIPLCWLSIVGRWRRKVREGCLKVLLAKQSAPPPGNDCKKSPKFQRVLMMASTSMGFLAMLGTSQTASLSETIEEGSELLSRGFLYSPVCFAVATMELQTTLFTEQMVATSHFAFIFVEGDILPLIHLCKPLYKIVIVRSKGRS